MTNEQIFKLAEKHFSYIAEYTTCGWIADDEDFLKFARAIYSEGFSDGCKEGSYSDYTWMRP